MRAEGNATPMVADAYGSMTVLSVEPALTRGESADFRHAVTEQLRAGGRWFIVDLARCGSFDSQGLEDLLWFQEQVGEVGGMIKVAGLKGHCRQIFGLVRFDKRLEVYDNVHDAVKSFQ
jgi:anti-anti-sigma regulatory factor